MTGSRDELLLWISQQQAVSRLGLLALTEVSRQELLDEACRMVAAELGTDLAGVLELLSDGSALVMQASVGRPQGRIGVQQIPAGPRSQGRYTLASHRPVVMRDSNTERRYELSPQLAAERITSGLSVSIGTDAGTYGIVDAHTYERRDFSDHDVAFLEGIANVLGRALARRAAEEEAERTRLVLEAVIEGTTDDIFVKDIDGRHIVVNASAAQTLGRSREELIGHTLHEVMPGRVAETMAESDRLVLQRGSVETFEETVTLGGETRVFLATKGPYRASDGTLLGSFGIARDITTRKGQEQELARSEERFRLAQEGARMGTWDVDLVAGITTWSDGLRTLFGVGPDVPAGFEHVVQLLHPDDRERVTQGVKDAYERGVDFEFECRIIRPDEELRWIMARSSSLRSDDGTLIRVLGVAVDITERKLVKEELVRSEETLRLAQTAARFGAWDWNIDTGELLWTPGMYEIFALDPTSSQPSYETFSNYIHPDDRDVVDAEIRRVLDSEESYYEYPCRIVRPSGDIRWLVSRGTIVRRPDGSPQRMLGVALDETERAQLETRLRQAEKLEALGQLAGGVAHDFNNLLVAIRGYGELALGRLQHGTEGVADDLAHVLAAADRAAGLTSQLLAFGRRQVLNPEVLDLNEVVCTINALLQRVIGDNVELVTTLAEQPVIVKADRGQLEQVITNLVVNGRDAMPSGGVLTVKVATEELEQGAADRTLRHAVLSITDEGSGIDAATASLIFEPFFTTKGEGGTGLGLATVQGIVAQSGGQVALETEPGRGSTFSVYLPLCAETPPPRHAPAVVGPKTGTETILLVDDDPVVRSVLSKMLAARGYDILHAADGHEAIACFEAHEAPIQLVVSDLSMPGLDGHQTIDRIREIDPATKALYMSGHTDDASIRAGGLSARTAFIQKPFSAEDLAGQVRELLDGVSG
jgi:PAS domain S-box-containing protein